MREEQPEPHSPDEPDEEDWLTPEEIVARDVECQIRENEEIQRWIAARCRQAVERWRAAHPWIDDPGMCVTVPVARLFLPDENV